MNPFAAFLSRFVPLSDEEQAVAAAVTTAKSYRKGDTIYAKGDNCRHLLFVVSGKARGYAADSDGKEFTLGFYFNDEDSRVENLFIGDYSSFLFGEPTAMYFEALTDLQTVRISYEDLQRLYASNPKYSEAGRLITEQAFRFMQRRTFALLTLSAADRYGQMVADESTVLQKFQQYYAASYLGVTPQSLSRLRAEKPRRD